MKVFDFSLMHEAKFNDKSTKSFLYDSMKLAIPSTWRPEFNFIWICRNDFKDTTSFDKMISIDNHNDVTQVNFVAGNNFHPELDKRERKKLQILWKPLMHHKKIVKVTASLRRIDPLSSCVQLPFVGRQYGTYLIFILHSWPGLFLPISVL